MQIISLRKQLEKEVQDESLPDQKGGFASLEGIWRGQLNVTDEDIEAVKICMKGYPEDKK